METMKKDQYCCSGMERNCFWAIVIGTALQLMVVLVYYVYYYQLIEGLVPDDAFYEFQIGRNIANGLGSVFSEGEPTNGYHPLWVVFIVAVQLFRLQPPEMLLCLHLISICFNVLSAVTLAKLFREFELPPWKTTMGIILILFSPWLVNITLSGLESALFIFCLLQFWVWAERIARKEHSGLADWTVFGVWSGLLMLARSDAIFFTAFAYPYLLFRKGVSGFFPLVLAGLVSSAVLAPWLIWNYHTFGSIMQSSAFAISALMHSGYQGQHGGVLAHPYTVKGVIQFILYKLTGLPYHVFLRLFIPSSPISPLQNPRLIYLAYLSVPILAIAGWYAFAKRRALARGLKVFPMMLWIIPSAALAVFYLYIRWYWQVWHMAPLLMCVLIAAVLLMPDRFARPRWSWIVGGAMTVLTLLTLHGGYYYSARGMIAASKAFYADAPKRMKIGMTDAGYAGYFSRHQIVNLDGVVNNRVEAAIMQGKFSEYVAGEKLDVVIMDLNRIPFYDRNMTWHAPVLTKPSQ